MSRKKTYAPVAYDASGHDAGPQPLEGEAGQRSTIGTDVLTYEQLDELGRELDAIRQRVLDDLGQADADYIRRVIKVQRAFEVLGRVGIFMPFFWPAFLAGVAFLALAKILENMEIGHNVMHGQYDWMNDPALDGVTYEWDIVAPAQDWKHSHNHVHHTYTNIHGMDRDIGYDLLRIDDGQKWYPNHRFNLPLAFVLMLIFEWGVMSHGVEYGDYRAGRISKEEFEGQKQRAWRKIRRQVVKDFVAYPALALPLIPFVGWWAPLAVMGGNLVANVIRNIWSFLIIFCGHFPADVQSFEEEAAKGENRGQWYLRQMLGSANISGSKLFHVMSGNLSHQVEHHLFPDIPARRYPHIAPEVREIAQRYGLQYNSGRFGKQLLSVARQLAVYGRKPDDPYMVGNSPESKALRRAKREEEARRREAEKAATMAA
ncbi:fatty acid desaturase family protein [Aeromicrobium terrae]|uniref:Acyl-CoA desaturase n=1 Tax=Aeromicrobium terrae TaxID=2498846 RepID=A0A5C8NLM8_9ACTN|nr:acyl-CoA desaturase [Aeromicrobium terrae]TXL62754.1 acyl-CoA desaturase [Aeromicrobium terrae]